MNLIIDIGNTSVKAALVSKGVIVSRERFSSADPEVIGRFAGHRRLEGVIVSSVGGDPSELLGFFGPMAERVHHLTARSRYPFAIDYDTPETLGVDRLAAAAGAAHRHPGADLLVIDAGSALTVDQVTGGAFRGGSISPGLAMRFRALHEYTDRLPLVTKRSGFTFPGRTTEDAIAGGVIMGLAYEIIEYIRTFEKKYLNPVAVITGGDGGIITPLAGGRLLHYPDLVTEGLNFLLETNV
ncbi:MAG: type III pantothenate kinase [Bacteroidota bacterium]|nr:type III pantothenate kinase [Bacteroidota bacterium]